MVNEREVSIPRQLARQLQFLVHSCEAYDNGFRDEALRLAVVLRVLFHSTKQQTSVLKHLTREDIALLSTCRIYSAPVQQPNSATVDFFFGIVPISIGPAGVAFSSPLGAAEHRLALPFSEWWSQIIFKTPQTGLVTRSILVTTAADKEGAHVDPQLTPEYAAMVVSPHVSSKTSRDPSEAAKPLTDAHHAALRQISYEVLNSPELLALAGSESTC